MPYVRRRRITRRRPSLRRRPRMLRRRSNYRRRVKTNPLVHHFKRTVRLTPIAAGAAFAGYGYSFTLSQLPAVAEFTNLFDQYRINKIVLKFVPDKNSAEFGAATSPIPTFHTVLDYNDATAPATLNEMLEYANHRMTRGSAVHTRVFTPASLDAVAAGGATSLSNPTWKQWLSTSASNIDHFGLKAGWEGGVVNSCNIFPYLTIYFSCKSVK